MLIPQAHQAVAAALLPRAWQIPLRPAAGPSALSGSGMNVPSSFLWASLPHNPLPPRHPQAVGFRPQRATLHRLLVAQLGHVGTWTTTGLGLLGGSASGPLSSCRPACSMFSSHRASLTKNSFW